MKCPVDGATLVMTERQGVEIDYCPTCRGIWLDRGELDKILDRSPAPGAADAAVTLREPAAPARAAPHDVRREEDRRDSRRHGDDDDDDHRRPYRKRRESFLSDLFDF